MRNVADGLEFWSRWRPDDPAVVMDGHPYSWSEVDELSSRWAAGLRNQGVSGGDRVGIFASNDIHWYAAFFGTLKLGAAVVPINVRLVAAELGPVLDKVGCKVVVTDADRGPELMRAPGLSEGTLVVQIGDGQALPSALPVGKVLGDHERTRFADVSPDSPAVIALTSGTTGAPKGVVFTHGSVQGAAQAFCAAEGWNSATRYLHVGSLCYTGGILQGLAYTSTAGATLFVESVFNPGRVIKVLRDEAITAWYGVPVLWEGITRQETFAGATFPHLRNAMTGGSPVPDWLILEFGRRGVALRQCYGMTEIGGTATLAPHWMAERDPASAGFPLMHTEIRIIDDQDHDVPSGGSGEIVLRSPGMMKEYWNDAAATAEAFVGGWLRTGDIGRLGPAGQLYVIGRKKDMVISGGLNVYPAEVELVVAKFPGIIEVTAFGAVDKRWGESVAVVIRSAAKVSVDDLVSFCRERLADYKVPRYVIEVDEPLPRNIMGKVLRNEVRRHIGDVSSRYSPAR